MQRSIGILLSAMSIDGDANKEIDSWYPVHRLLLWIVYYPVSIILQIYALKSRPTVR